MPDDKNRPQAAGTRIGPDDPRFWPRKGFVCPPHPYGEYKNSRVVVLPVPYDSTVTARAVSATPPEPSPAFESSVAPAAPGPQ